MAGRIFGGEEFVSGGGRFAAAAGGAGRGGGFEEVGEEIFAGRDYCDESGNVAGFGEFRGSGAGGCERLFDGDASGVGGGGNDF